MATATEIRCHGHTNRQLASADFDNDTHVEHLVDQLLARARWQNRTQFLRNGGPPKYHFEDKSESVKLRWQESYARRGRRRCGQRRPGRFLSDHGLCRRQSRCVPQPGRLEIRRRTKSPAYRRRPPTRPRFADINGDGYLRSGSPGARSGSTRSASRGPARSTTMLRFGSKARASALGPRSLARRRQGRNQDVKRHALRPAPAALQNDSTSTSASARRREARLTQGQSTGAGGGQQHSISPGEPDPYVLAQGKQEVVFVLYKEI